jgi:Fe-S cluster assembly protein SufD
MARVAFRPAVESAPRRLSLGALDPFRLPGEIAARLVFVNGIFAPELSSLAELPAGVTAGSLAAELAARPRDIEPHLGRLADFEPQPFVALNLAFVLDGAYVRVARGTVLDRPLHLLFVSSAPGEPTVSFPRNLIVAEAGSQVAIVESYVGTGREVYFTNAVTEVQIGDDAVVDHVKLQGESDKAFHVANLQVEQGRASQFVSHSFSLGGGLVRNDLGTVFGAEGGECTLNGLYMVGGRQHVDNHTSIDHAKPHCTSRELYKGVLDGKSKAVFNGKIVVRPDAQKTNARQTNKNLILSDDTGVNSKPQLEIFANDVKCAHGATVGQVDKDALFYMRSRGLALGAARNLLTYAFASEILEEIRVKPARAYVAGLLAARLPDGRAVLQELAP